MGGRLEGRTVLVTGASSGLGARFARVVAAEGANVVVGARRLDRLQTLTEEIHAAGGHCIAVTLDVTNEESIMDAFAAAETAFGTVTGVIANAGVNHSGKALDLAADQLDAVFAVNVRGIFLTAREAARRLRAAGRSEEGRIVLISSIMARTTASGLVAYSASKAAVSHMGRALAREWARTGPNVTILSPGYIATDLSGDWFTTDAGRRQIAGWPRRRLVETDALDEPILWLLSGTSRNVTGTEIVIDDGQAL